MKRWTKSEKKKNEVRVKVRWKRAEMVLNISRQKKRGTKRHSKQ